MYGVILVPVDGSPLGERALSLAIPIAKQHGARLTLLHVHEPLLPTTSVAGGAPVRDPALDRHLRADRDKYVARLAKKLRRETALAIEAEIREGPVAETIDTFARQTAVELIVMSTHGRGGFGRFWLGSVADGLLRRVAIPLLLVRAGRGRRSKATAPPLFSRILVPLDGSPLAEQAIAESQRLVGSAPTHLTLAHVVHPALVAATMIGAPEGDQVARVLYLEPLAEQLRSATLTVSTELVPHTNVARALLTLANGDGADLIALASRGQGGIQRLVLGSVADKLIRSADQPVLVCPGRPAA